MVNRCLTGSRVLMMWILSFEIVEVKVNSAAMFCHVKTILLLMNLVWACTSIEVMRTIGFFLHVVL
jgi:hypothetical protein